MSAPPGALVWLYYDGAATVERDGNLEAPTFSLLAVPLRL